MKVETLVPILCGLIGIVPALLTYKAAFAKTKPLAGTKPSRILSFTDPTIRIQSWNMRRLKWLFCLPSLLYVILVAVIFRDAAMTLVCAGIAIFSIAFLAVLRDKPPSRTIKTADFLLEGNQERILRDCLVALEKIGAQVGRYDSTSGVIEAGTRLNWRSWGEIIRIEATKTNPNGVSLRITSDSVQPSTLFDMGANARNIRRIKTELI